MTENRGRIRRALERIAHDLNRPGRIAGKSVKAVRRSDDTFHRLRIGDYRVMYDAIDPVRVILVFGIVDRAELGRWLRSR